MPSKSDLRHQFRRRFSHTAFRVGTIASPLRVAKPEATKRVKAPESSDAVGIALLIASDHASNCSSDGRPNSRVARMLAIRIHASDHSKRVVFIGFSAWAVSGGNRAVCGFRPLYCPGLGSLSLYLELYHCQVLTGGGSSGYTRSMKTAVSIPDDVFEEAERLVAELQTSRSQLYSRALQEFVARHSPDRLTEAMNRVVDEVGAEVDELTAKASRQVLERVEW